MRVATYTRISTDEVHQPHSLEAQTDRLGSYIKSQEGWERARQFSDQMSGSRLDRPGLQRTLTEARAQRYDLLLVYRVDRLARSVRGLAQILEELDQAGVAFRSATEPFDTATPAGRMMVQMLGVFAEFERASIIERVIAGMERKASKGEWCGGARPYGYDADAETNHLVVNLEEAPAVPIIFDLYVNKRVGARGIANWLNERGHRTKASKPWAHTSVLTVLRNQAYIGEIFFRGAYYPAPHPPLVDRDLFEAAQVLLEERGQNHSKRGSNRSDYLLAGLVRCARCGKRFVGNAGTGKKGYRYTYYTCFSRQRYGRQSCTADRLRADHLEAAVLESMLATYENTTLLEQAATASAERAQALLPQQRDQLSAVEKEIRKAEETIDRYLLAFEEKTMPEALCGSRIRSLGEQLSDLQARRSELMDALDHAQPVSVPSKTQVKQFRQRLTKALEEGTASQRKALLQALIHEILVEGHDSIIPTFNFPDPGMIGQGGGVRALSRSVPPAGFEPATFTLKG